MKAKTRFLIYLLVFSLGVVVFFASPEKGFASQHEKSWQAQFGCHVGGDVKDCEKAFSSGEPNYQTYKVDYVNIQNDDPVPIVNLCINDTGTMGNGFCKTIQDTSTGPNSGPETYGDFLVNDFRKAHYVVIHIRVEGQVTNDNDFEGLFTAYHRRVWVESLSTSTPTVQQGGSGKLTWTTKVADDAVVALSRPDGSGGRIRGGTSWNVAVNETNWAIPEVLNQVGTYTFFLTAHGPGGNGYDEDFKEVNINVVAPPPPPPPPTPSGTIKSTIPGSASPTNCTKSGSFKCDTVLDYTTQNTVVASIKRNGVIWKTEADIGTNYPAGSQTDPDPPVGVNTYAIWGKNSQGTTEELASVAVTINPEPTPLPIPSADIKCNGADSCTIAYNTWATLSWTSSNVSSCSVSPGGWSGTSSSGQPTPNLTSTTTYTLSCTGLGGSAQDSVEIKVLSAAAASCGLEAIPNSGTAPLNGVDFKITAQNLSGTIKYEIDYDGNNTFDFSQSTSQNPYTKVDGYNYSNSGTYYPQARVSIGSTISPNCETQVLVSPSGGPEPSLPPPSQPVVNKPSCSDTAYNSNPNFNISWSGTPNSSFGFYVDIDQDPADWAIDSYYNKNVGANNWADGTNFNLYDNGTPALSLMPNVTYSTQVYNGSHSPVTSWRVNDCSMTGQIQCNNNGNNNCTINLGDSVAIKWSAPGANACNILPMAPAPGWGPVSPDGSNTDYPTATRTYELECWNSVAQRTLDFITVNVSGGSPSPSPGLITITGIVYNDVNRNGSKGVFEPGLSGRTVSLLSEDEGTTYDQAFTDASGRYRLEWPAGFTGVGNLNHPPPPGWMESPTGSSNLRVNPGDTNKNFGVYKLTPTANIRCQQSGSYTDGPCTVNYGGSTNLQWCGLGLPCLDVESCTLSPSVPGLSGNPTFGTYSTGALTTSTAFSLNCVGKYGTGNVSDVVQVTVNPVVPLASNATVTQPNYCLSGPAATIGWTYSDPSGSPQSAYQVQVDEQGSFQSPEADSGKIFCQNCRSYSTLQGLLQFNVTYKARVRVWNQYDLVSNWTESGFWKTPLYAYPQVDFTWSPALLQPNQPVQFTDQTQFFDGNPQGHRWSWLFGDGGSAASQNPQYTYSQPNIYNVTLTATDNQNQFCSITKPVNVQIINPIWKEVNPGG